MSKSKKAVFFCNDKIENFQIFNYYKQDIDFLKKMGYEVILVNKYHKLPIDFDIIFIWWWTYALFPILWAKLLRKKSLVTGVLNFRIEHPNIRDYFDREWHQKFLISKAIRLTNANLFITRNEYVECKKFFGLKNAYNVPLSVTKTIKQTSQKKEKNYLLNISWSGKQNIRRKGILDLIEAFSRITINFPNVTLVLAGPKGDGHQELVQKAKDLNCLDSITFLGEVSETKKHELYSQALLYVQPSYFEGFGLATAEAMLNGCCVVVTDVGETKNVVGECGIYVTPGDITQLSETIQEHLNSQEKRRNFGILAKNRIEDEFSEKKKFNALKAIIDDL